MAMMNVKGLAQQPRLLRSAGCAGVRNCWAPTARQLGAGLSVRPLLRKQDLAHTRQQRVPTTCNAATPGEEGTADSAAQPPAPQLAKLAQEAMFVRWLTWWSFWIQLALSVVSGVILLFSLGAREGMVPPPSTVLAVVGVAAALISTFLNFVYRKAANKIASLDGSVHPKQLVQQLEMGTQLNLAGMGATILALQAEVGSLLTKTLSSSASNPYTAAAREAPVAFDVFTVQASTNTVMAHFASILFLQWMQRIMNRRIRLAVGADQLAAA